MSGMLRALGLFGTLTRRQRPHNLLLWSEQFDNAAWSKGDAVVTQNTTTAPDGNLTADTITFNANSTVPSQSVSIVGSAAHSVSFFIHESSTVPFVRVRFSTAAGSVSAFYNVATASFGTMNAGFTPGTVGNLVSGWRRVSVNYLPLSADGGLRALAISATTADNSSTAATGATLVIWGAQLNQGELQPYHPTVGVAV